MARATQVSSCLGQRVDGARTKLLGGGLPIIVDGQVVGGIGPSNGTIASL